ncbi:small subunit processome component 20 homolog [Culicoides brevitarsis]|uniref:small subunit processome component 20 homolog n=1 Tax=Culicoides brevitarsis TaxID=469753 RepID=UPI00307B59DD
MGKNTFKFQSFSNLIAGIDIRKKTLYNIEHKYETKNDEASFFCDAMQKWRTLNLTNEFVQLDKDLSQVQNLTQLIHQKERVCAYLVDVFNRTTEDSLQAVLEIVTAVARDLSEDFYPYFSDIFAHLTSHLQTKNAEKLEWVLKCMALLFKFLKKSIKKDFAAVFHKILPLLASDEHIVNFIAECFAFVTREIGKSRDFLVFVLSSIDEEHITGCGRLFFEMIHGVANTFHLEAKPILTLLYESLFDKSLKREVLYKIHVQLMTDMLELIDKKHLNIFLSVFYANLKKSFDVYENDKKSLEYFLLLLGQLIEGAKIDVQPLEHVFKVFDCDVDDEILGIISKLASAIILSKNSNVTDIECNRLAKKVMMIKNTEIVKEFVFATIDATPFDVIIMPEVIRYVAKNCNSDMMEALAKIFIQKNCVQADLEADSNSYLYPNEMIAKSIKSSISVSCKARNVTAETLSGILCLPHVTKSIDTATLKDLKTLTTHINEKLSSDFTKNDLILLQMLHRTRTKLSDDSCVAECSSTITKIASSVTNLTNLNALQLLNTCLNVLKSAEDDQKLDEELKNSLKSSLIRNLASHNSNIRLFTIKCLSNLDENEVYDVMQEVEERNLDPFTYKEHLILYDRLKVAALKEDDIKLTVLHFFYGVLWKNFKLIWDPVITKIQELSEVIPISAFWESFKEQLCSVEPENSTETDENEDSEDIFSELSRHFQQTSEPFDRICHRQLLWKALTKLECCDIKNRDIVEIYLKFHKDEFLYEHDDEADDDEEETNDKPSHSAKQKLIKSHLEVFHAMKNSPQIYKKAEVCETFKNLITSREKEVSVLALKCLLQSKFNKILTEDARNTLIELLEGKIPEEVTKINKIIPLEHHTELIDIVMRIVHARLLTRPSKTDRMTYLIHKRKVLGFLKNFSKTDVNKFFHISFDAVDELQPDSKRINKKFLSANLQLLNLILTELSGNVDDEGVKFLIQLLVRIISVTKGLEYEAEIRAKVFGNLCLVFEQFVEFKFTEKILGEVFDVFVWPFLSHFESDCKVSASGLMKLFIEWSKNAKYFTFLERKPELKTIKTPIFHIIQLLKSENTAKDIKITIYNLLTRIVEENTSAAEPTELLKPYHETLLMAMKDDVTHGAIELDKLDIMPLLHVLQEDKNIEGVNELVEIFLNVLYHKKTSKDTEKVRAILDLISNSVHKITNVSEFLQKLSPLFDSIVEIENRKLLCKTAKNLLTKNDAQLALCSIIEHFNALDRRWTNQPDYNRRYEAFSLIDNYVAHHKWSTDFIFVIFHSCMHILTYDQDIFLRNQTTKYLFLMFNELDKDLEASQIEFLINNLFLTTISAKLKDPKLKCRTECIQLLGILVSKYPEANTVLDDLKVLSNKKETEHDFFENVTHLQENMQHKAIMKYIKMLQGDGIQFQSQLTLVNFVLPILSYYICNEEYRKKSKIVEVATMAITQTAGVLAWKNYEALLKFYLQKLQKETVFRKQMINISVGILNSFHFKEECKAIPMEIDDESPEQAPKTDRILKSILKDILPSLMKIMNAPSVKVSTPGSSADKREQKYNADRENVLILSLAQALIKLLQKLPKDHFDQPFTSVVYKVSYYLKSTSKAVRIIAKDTLRKILIAVGPSHLEKIINHLSSCLTRSNEIHVLTVNVNSLIEAIRPSLKPAHLEAVLQVVLQICLNDIFKPQDSYRNGMKLQNRRNEAKPSKKSFLTLEMLAAGISEKCILDLITPIKEKLSICHSTTQVQKIQECFNKIVNGLCKNENIEKEALLTLAYGILSESIDELKINKENREVTDKNINRKKLKVNGDSLLIPSEPGRKGSVNQKVDKWKGKSNASLLPLFGLQILHTLLKQKLVVGAKFREYLDLHISNLLKFIEDVEVKVKISALKCMTCIWKFQYKSETLLQTEPSIVKNIFEIVRKFVDQTIVRKDENLQLIKSAFKALIVFIKNVRPGVFVPTQIELMLSYVQNEMENPNENAMAFALLRAIIEKKLQSKTIAIVAKKVAELSIYSEYEWVRNESKLIIQAHIKNYPSKLNEDFYIKHYIKHQRNELKYLQPSAPIMMKSIVTLIRQDVLENHWAAILECLTKFLIYKDLEHVENQLRDPIKVMFNRFTNDQLENLLKLVTDQLDSDEIPNKRVGVKLCDCLLETKKEYFSQKMSDLIPKLMICLMPRLVKDVPGKFVLLNHGVETKNNAKKDKEDDKTRHLVVDTLRFSLRLLEEFPLNVKNADSMQLATSIITSRSNFFEEMSAKRVKLLFVQILDRILSQISREKLLEALKDNKLVDGVPFEEPQDEIRDLTEKIVEEIHFTDSNEAFMESVNNVILAIIEPLASLYKPDMTMRQLKTFSFVWLNKILKEMLNKATENMKQEEYHSTLLKTKIYDCLGKIVEKLSCENILVLYKTLIMCQYKDMTDESHSEVKECSNVVWQKIVKKFENEPELWAKMQEIYSHARQASEMEQRKKMSKRKAFDIGGKPKKPKTV